MTELKFDDTKSFEANLEAFLVHMEADDPEMGKILRANIDALKDTSDDTSRRRARTEFNPFVVASLSKMGKDDEDA